MGREKKNSRPPQTADIVVISILPKLELQAILAEFERQWPSERFQPSQGSTNLIEVATQSGWRPKIAIRAIHDAGNLASAIETTNLLHRFHPRFAFLCGIAGNVNHEKRHLGDVVVSSSYAYRLATRMSEGKRIEWAMPSGPAISRRMHDRAGTFFASNDIDFSGADLKTFFGKAKIHQPAAVEVGKIFCWDMVLDCDETRRELLEIDREYRAVEMEMAGFLKAIAAFSNLKQMPVDGLVFRGLSDPASKKAVTDVSTVKWRPYAARNAARALVQFIHSMSEDDCEDSAF